MLYIYYTYYAYFGQYILDIFETLTFIWRLCLLYLQSAYVTLIELLTLTLQ